MTPAINPRGSSRSCPGGSKRPPTNSATTMDKTPAKRRTRLNGIRRISHHAIASQGRLKPCIALSPQIHPDPCNFRKYSRREGRNPASIIESIPMLKRAVVTGMGVVSPNGIGNTAFCRAVLDGKSGVKLISRFDTSEVPVKIAGEIANGDFNELDWMEARERKHVSRCVPLAIAAATEALREAGIDPTKLSLDQQREIGVALGTGGGANDFTDHQYHLYYQGKIKQVSIFTIPSGTMGTMSSEISMRFGFRGPSQVVTSGCTSSTDAIAYAARQIQLGAQPAMLVGGTDSPLAWGILKAFILMRIMTESWNHEPERGSRPFNLDRDGFVIAEGSWMFVIEEYERAKARGARIYAEIAGYGSTCEAFHRVRLQECGEE